MKKAITMIMLAGLTSFLIATGPADLRSENLRKPLTAVSAPAFSNLRIERMRTLTYEAVPKKALDQQSARNLLSGLAERSALKMPFEKVEKLNGRFIFSSPEDPSAVFDIDANNGAFLLNTGLKRYSGDESSKNLPSGKEAPELAKKYLINTGFLPKNGQEMVLAHVGGLNMAVSKEGRSVGNYHKLVTVRFSRVLNGLPVQGPGSKIVLQLGHDGELQGMIHNWPEVSAKSLPAAALKSDEEIRHETGLRLRREAGEAQSVAIRSSRLVLYDDGRGVIEPAIHVIADALYKGPATKESVNNPVDFYVPLLKAPKAIYPFMKSAESKMPEGDGRQKSAEAASRQPSQAKDWSDGK